MTGREGLFDLARLRRNWSEAMTQQETYRPETAQGPGGARALDVIDTVPIVLSELRQAVQMEFGAHQRALEPFVMQVEQAAQGWLRARAQREAERLSESTGQPPAEAAEDDDALGESLLTSLLTMEDAQAEVEQTLLGLEDMLEVFLAVGAG